MLETTGAVSLARERLRNGGKGLLASSGQHLRPPTCRLDSSTPIQQDR